MLLSLAGVGLIFGSVGIVAEYLVVEATSGRREAKRMADAVNKLSGHYILCGFGRVGLTVARERRNEFALRAVQVQRSSIRSSFPPASRPHLRAAS